MAINSADALLYVKDTGSAVVLVNQGQRLKEIQTLTNAQVIVVFATVGTGDIDVFISGDNADGEMLMPLTNYVITNATTITMTNSYPAGTQIIGINYLLPV